MIHDTFESMGTVVSAALDAPIDLAPARRVFDDLDRTFSLYDPRSPLSRIANGELLLTDAAPAVRAEYARALSWRSRTGGWFTPHRPDDVIDLSGTVKAVALARAAHALASAGAVGMIGAGGDIAVVGHPSRTLVGVADPADRTRLLTTVDLGCRRGAATSGSAERGEHIWSRAGRSDLLQVTVLADDIVEADVLATAAIAGGGAHLDELTQAFDVDVLAVARDGSLRATEGFRRRMQAASAPVAESGRTVNG